MHLLKILIWDRWSCVYCDKKKWTHRGILLHELTHVPFKTIGSHRGLV